MSDSKLLKPVIAALLLTALPLRVGHDANGKVMLTYAPAMAKSGSGSDGDGGNDGGEDGGDDGGEDGGDDGGDDGGEDGGDDGGEDGGDDGGEDGGDDGGDDSGEDDGVDGENSVSKSGKPPGKISREAAPLPSPSLAISRIEVSNSGIEIRYADGTREEIERGIYELKDRNGKTLLKRRATGPDISRLRVLAERVSIRNVTRGKPSLSGVARARVARNDIQIEYANGWVEIIKRGRYLLKDPFSRTIVQRPATTQDRRRLSKLAKQK